MKNNRLETEMLEDYLDGKLDAKAMHFIERIALEDPFVFDALEGLRQSPRRSVTLSILQRQLKQRVEMQPVLRRKWRLTTHRLSIATTAAILFVAASVMFWMQEVNNRQKKKQDRQVEVNLTPMPETSKTVQAATTAGAVAAANSTAPNNSTGELGFTVYPQFPENGALRGRPAGGWSAFRKYIIANNQLLHFPIQHSLTVTFGIDEKGRPMQIKVEDAPDMKYTNEALRLLNAGPDWEIRDPNGSSEQLGKDVSVKMYF